jgi:hypothetical protein
VFQTVEFSYINDLKFTYVHLQFKNFFSRVIPPDPHDKGDERERRGRRKEGERRKGRDGMG